jgi:uncharacterized SAM-binding protein YcdF (DUF218 family)
MLRVVGTHETSAQREWHGEPRHDAIIVLGGGIRDDGTLPTWVTERLDRAIERWTGEYIIPSSAYTVYRPPVLDSRGFPLLEGTVCSEYLQRHGIPADRILPENSSFDTIGNAYFTRTVHCDQQELRRLLVITSEFHMPRAREIFDWVFGMAPSFYSLEYDSTPNTAMEPTALEARRRKEAASLLHLQSTKRRITRLQDLHVWLFSEHGAYAPTGHIDTIGDAVASY